jgi:hypothetical protein
MREQHSARSRPLPRASEGQLLPHRSCGESEQRVETRNADPRKRIGVAMVHGPLPRLASLGLRLLRVVTGYGWDIADGCGEGKKATGYVLSAWRRREVFTLTAKKAVSGITSCFQGRVLFSRSDAGRLHDRPCRLFGVSPP